MAAPKGPGVKACKPRFLVIGAQKGGTSTLSKLMSEHHQIEEAEEHYFAEPEDSKSADELIMEEILQKLWSEAKDGDPMRERDLTSWYFNGEDDSRIRICWYFILVSYWYHAGIHCFLSNRKRRRI